MFDSPVCFLVGPVTPASQADWRHPQAIAFGPQDSWADVSARWPLGQTPAFVLVDLAYTAVPPWVWEVRLPRVLLVTDWDLQGTLTRLAARHAARIFTDPQGVVALQRAGIAHAQRVHRFGLMGDFARLPPVDPAAPRDIDVLFVGNFNPAIQGERLPWLARLARLSPRYRIHFSSNAWGPAYRALLGRAKVVFNRALKGEINQRVAEAAWGGAALFQEADNPTLADWGQPGVHYQAYDAVHFETALDALLRDEPRRQRLARSAWERTQALSWAAQRDVVLARLLEEREALRQAQAARPVPTSEQRLLLRVWVALSAREQADEGLLEDLERSAPGYAGLALAALRRDDPALAARRLHAEMTQHPDRLLPALGLVEQLLSLGQTDLARQGALRLLRRLHTTAARTEGFPASEEEWPLSDPSFGPWRVGWERLGWHLADDDHARRLARREWLRGRLESLLAALTGDLTHYYEAARAWPGEPGREAALGCALARAGHREQALGHLQAERERYPFDIAAARALMQAYRDARMVPKVEALAHEQAMLHRAAPDLVPAEPWFANTPVGLTGVGTAMGGDSVGGTVCHHHLAGSCQSSTGACPAPTWLEGADQRSASCGHAFTSGTRAR